jgi:radical SAM superfamily enzyme YgiQ (UPF0313 family)
MQATVRDLSVLLLSTYDLGHQPHGLASPAAWLREAGARVTCRDLAIDELDESEVTAADLIAFHLPMHAATRLAVPVAQRVRSLNPRAHLCFYGLYAPVNESFLRKLGAQTILGGEYEHGLADLYRRLRAAPPGHAGPQTEPVISLARQAFRTPDRGGLPGLERYAYLSVGGARRTAGYTEATRGCKHTCRHCPIVPVYGGKFRVIARDVVMADVRQQVEAGAAHITFGDPDFFNAPGHALRLVTALHEEFPWLSYDVTIKIEHLVTHARHLETLRETGCMFVTSAVEAVDDTILERLDKHHTRADLESVVSSFRAARLTLSPTFVAFTPWTTTDGYVDLLDTIHRLGLAEAVAPVQYAIRLLIPAGSRLLELDEIRDLVEEFDSAALVFPWCHPDPALDELQREVMAVVTSAAPGDDRAGVFARIRELAYARAGRAAPVIAPGPAGGSGDVPRLSEPWYCCAEPTEGQLSSCLGSAAPHLPAFTDTAGC